MIKTLTYTNYLDRIPKDGKHILAYQTDSEIVVYMAFNDAIANYAIEHQKLGGSYFSFNRMSWIKTNFLWMMHRSGWANKENQNRILAIWIKKTDFERILEQAAHSSYKPEIYETHENWEESLKLKKVRLQWDPDHTPHGNREDRKAIQLGLKDKMLRFFAADMIVKIDDVTEFVKTQKSKLKSEGINNLEVPKEEIFKPHNLDLFKVIGLDS